MLKSPWICKINQGSKVHSCRIVQWNLHWMCIRINFLKNKSIFLTKNGPQKSREVPYLGFVLPVTRGATENRFPWLAKLIRINMLAEGYNFERYVFIKNLIWPFQRTLPSKLLELLDIALNEKTVSSPESDAFPRWESPLEPGVNFQGCEGYQQALAVFFDMMSPRSYWFIFQKSVRHQN